MIEWYNAFNTKGFPDELAFGDFNDRPIPYYYYNLLNDEDEDCNNIPGSPIENVLLDNKGAEKSFVSNDEDIDDKIIIYDDDSLA